MSDWVFEQSERIVFKNEHNVLETEMEGYLKELSYGA